MLYVRQLKESDIANFETLLSNDSLQILPDVIF